MTIEERAKKRIITILSRHQEPVKIRAVQSVMGGGLAGQGFFRDVLIGMVEDGTVWHEDGFLKLNGEFQMPGMRQIPESKSLGIERK